MTMATFSKQSDSFLEKWQKFEKLRQDKRKYTLKMPRTLSNNNATSLDTSFFHVSDNSYNSFQTENALGMCSSWIKLSIAQNLFIFHLYDMVLKLHHFSRAIEWDCLNLKIFCLNFFLEMLQICLSRVAFFIVFLG